MRTYKYLVKPGYVQSVTDGQWHYITAGQLMRLYKVSPADCFILRSDLSDLGRLRQLEGIEQLIALRPDKYGRYNLVQKGDRHGDKKSKA